MTTFRANDARQIPVLAWATVLFSDLVSGVDKNVIQVPQNSVIIQGAIEPIAVFNSVTSDVLDVGDVGSENRYKNDADLTALAVKALVPTGYKYTADGWISVRWTGVGTAPTTGSFRLWVLHYQTTRSDFTQG